MCPRGLRLAFGLAVSCQVLVHQLMGEEQKRLLEVVRSKSIEEVLAGGKKVFNADGPIDKARKR